MLLALENIWFDFAATNSKVYFSLIYQIKKKLRLWVLNITKTIVIFLFCFVCLFLMEISDIELKSLMYF